MQTLLLENQMDQGRKKIMVIDDEFFVHSWLTKVLEKEGYEVEVCTDPAQGYEKCASRPEQYGLVFMDVCFPAGPVGYRVAKGISAMQELGGPAVIGMTGHRKHYCMKDCEDSGMADLLLKPLFPHLIANLAERHFVAPQPPEMA